jgi:hypothetical protein
MDHHDQMPEPTPTKISITIYCPQVLRDLWCSPPDHPAHGQLSGQWYAQYPGLFDKQDLRMARTQWNNHFYEWFAAIHLFQRYGACSMVEKYDQAKSHVQKYERYARIVPEDQLLKLKAITEEQILEEDGKHHGVQLPDLFVPSRDETSFHFAEVKGGSDKLRPRQIKSHEEIGKMGLTVKVIQVELV